MAREKGTFNFSANLEVKKQGPLDARQSLITYAELTQAATWQDESGKMYLFDGLTVPVINGSEKQYYMLIDAAQYNLPASWKRIDAGAAVSEEEIYIVPGNIFNLIQTNPDKPASEIKTILGELDVLKEAIEQKKPVFGNFYGNLVYMAANAVGTSEISFELFNQDSFIKITVGYDSETNDYVDGTTGVIKQITFKDDLKEEVYFLPGDITTLTNGMTGTALQAVVGTYSALKAAIDAKKVILCNIGGTSGSCPVSARIVSGNVLVSAVYVDKAVNKTTTFGINLIVSSTAWATETATAGLYKKDLATTDIIPGSEFYRVPGDITTLTSSSTAADIKAAYGDLSTFKAALTAKKAVIGVINDAVFFINAGLAGSTNITTLSSIGQGILQHNIQIDDSDYVRISVIETELAVKGSVVESVTATANKGIEIGGTATKPTVGLKLDTTTPGNITFALGANGLKATLAGNAVKTGDKVLKIETDRSISSTISLGYDTETKRLQLKGIDEEVFNELDATPFIKDGMLDSATLEVNPSGQSAGTYIKLVFNTESGKDPIYINVTSLIDVYTQGNGISISGKTISVKLDTAGNSEGYLKLTAAGLKVEGVNAAVAAAIAEAFSWHDAND